MSIIEKFKLALKITLLGNFDEFIRLINEKINKNSKIYNDFLLRISNHQRNEREEKLGTIEKAHYYVFHNKIVDSLMSIVDDLEEKDTLGLSKLEQISETELIEKFELANKKSREEDREYINLLQSYGFLNTLRLFYEEGKGAIRELQNIIADILKYNLEEEFDIDMIRSEIEKVTSELENNFSIEVILEKYLNKFKNFKWYQGAIILSELLRKKKIDEEITQLYMKNIEATRPLYMQTKVSEKEIIKYVKATMKLSFKKLDKMTFLKLKLDKLFLKVEDEDFIEEWYK